MIAIAVSYQIPDLKSFVMLMVSYTSHSFKTETMNFPSVSDRGHRPYRVTSCLHVASAFSWVKMTSGPRVMLASLRRTLN